MINLICREDDWRYVFVTGDASDIKSLEEYLNKIPQYQFLPTYTGPKRPEVFLHRTRGPKGGWVYWCHGGLWRQIVEWAEENGTEIGRNVTNSFKYTPFKPSLDEFKKTVGGWGLTLEPRDYQVEAAWKILCYRQSLSELATRAGKTLIAYMVFRWLREKAGVRKILMIVPSIQLVKQGVEDMKQYGDFFQSETVWARGESCACADLTIGTFQSLVNKLDRRSKKYDPSFFNGFDAVCVDEAHHLVCRSIDKILSQPFMKDIKIKFGFTGTLPPRNTIDSFACQSLMGPKIQEIKTIELVEKGFLACPVITQVQIPHPMTDELLGTYIKCGEYVCSPDKKERVGGKLVKKMLPVGQREFTMTNEKELPLVLKAIKGKVSKADYYEAIIKLCRGGSGLLNLEQMLVHRDHARLDAMDRIIQGLDKNVIVFGHHVEYMRFLKKHFEEEFPGRKVMLITGSTSLKKRQETLDKMLESDDVILVASYGCMATGITFRRVDYAILAQSFKSGIINLQSIGRGLLKTSSKDKFVVYDLVDLWPTGRIKAHGAARQKLYKENKYPYQVVKL